MDASQFIASFERFIEGSETGANVRWNSPASPWFDYLGLQFQLGLNPAQRSEALRDGKQWRCDALLMWERLGFVALYPKLRTIFDNETVLAHFNSVVVPNHSRAYRRCQALTGINGFGAAG